LQIFVANFFILVICRQQPKSRLPVVSCLLEDCVDPNILNLPQWPTADRNIISSVVLHRTYRDKVTYVPAGMPGHITALGFHFQPRGDQHLYTRCQRFPNCGPRNTGVPWQSFNGSQTLPTCVHKQLAHLLQCSLFPAELRAVPATTDLPGNVKSTTISSV